MKQRLATMAILTIFGMAGTASASVIGHLNVAQCASGGVTVSLLNIDWTLPVGPPDGCIQADTSTLVTFGTTGSLVTGELGRINDLGPAGLITQNTGFMTFTGPSGSPAVGSGTIAFNLVSLGPGLAMCTGFETVGQSCSVNGASPIILTRTGSLQTTLTLPAFGNVSDGTLSNW